MGALEKPYEMIGPTAGPRAAVITTLYDLIEAITDGLGPDEEDLVVPTVLGLMESGALKQVSEPKAGWIS
jgi:hypothetical protein